jgi:hypothetical protein
VILFEVGGFRLFFGFVRKLPPAPDQSMVEPDKEHDYQQAQKNDAVLPSSAHGKNGFVLFRLHSAVIKL